MHAGRVESSRRLQETLGVLADGLPHTTREIAERTGSQAVHSDVAALRENGLDVVSRFRETAPSGARVYEYYLVRSLAQWEIFVT